MKTVYCSKWIWPSVNSRWSSRIVFTYFRSDILKRRKLFNVSDMKRFCCYLSTHLALVQYINIKIKSWIQRYTMTFQQKSDVSIGTNNIHVLFIILRHFRYWVVVVAMELQPRLRLRLQLSHTSHGAVIIARDNCPEWKIINWFWHNHEVFSTSLLY